MVICNRFSGLSMTMNDNENMFITTDIYSISETNARHKYIGKSIKQ